MPAKKEKRARVQLLKISNIYGDAFLAFFFFFLSVGGADECCQTKHQVLHRLAHNCLFVCFAMLGKFLEFKDDRSCRLGRAHVQIVFYHWQLLQ